MPAEWTVSLGEANELLVDRFSISRERQDEFAARSHNLADAAWKAGFYDDLVVPVPGADLARDESIRPGSSAEKLAGLKPSFRPGRHDHRRQRLAAERRRLRPAARLRGRGAGSASHPLARIAGRGTARAGAAGLRVRAGRGGREGTGPGRDLAGPTSAAVELNEAFAVQSLACVDAWKVDPEIVNAKGGAIAIGHPLGASGGRILGTLAHRLRESGDRWGVAAICIGVGQALAVVLENVTDSVS